MSNKYDPILGEYRQKDVGGGSGSSTWGSITGTLSDQTDLWNTLQSRKQFAINKTYAELSAMATGGTLVPEQTYRITDFRYQHTIPNTSDTWTDSVEPIILTASSTTTLSPMGLSDSYLNDIIYYELNTSDGDTNTDMGRIFKRIDQLYQNDIGFDYRSTKCRRWESVEGSGFYDSKNDTGFAYSDFYTFGNSKTPENVIEFRSNILILPRGWMNNRFDGNFYTNTVRRSMSGNTVFSDFTQNNFFNIYDNFMWNQYISNNVIFELSNNHIVGDGMEGNVGPGGTIAYCTIDGFFGFNTIKGRMLNTSLITYELPGYTFKQITGNEFGSFFGVNDHGDDMPNYLSAINIRNNKFGDGFGSNTIITGTSTLDDKIEGNIVGNFCQYNTINGRFYSNNIIHDFGHNTISGGFHSNNIASGFHDNIFDSGSGEFANNLIKGTFYGNTMNSWYQSNGNEISSEFKNNLITCLFNNNRINSEFDGNIINCSDFESNIIDSKCSGNVISGINSFQSCIFGKRFRGNTFDGTGVDILNVVAGINFGGNSIHGNFLNNSFGNECRHNIFTYDFNFNTVGNNFGYELSTDTNYGNTITVPTCTGNIIGSDAFNNSITADNFINNEIGGGWQNQTITSDYSNHKIDNIGGVLYDITVVSGVVNATTL